MKRIVSFVAYRIGYFWYGAQWEFCRGKMARREEVQAKLGEDAPELKDIQQWAEG